MTTGEEGGEVVHFGWRDNSTEDDGAEAVQVEEANE